MDVYFDVLQIRDDVLIASGWVTPGIRENKVKIYAVDAAKKEIPCTVMRNCRPDVGVAKYQDARVEDLGMFLEIPCKGRMFVEIVLEEYEPQGTTPVKRQTLPLHIPVVAARGTLEKAKDSLRQVRAKAYTAADRVFKLEDKEYDRWFQVMRASREELAAQREEKLTVSPKFSIIVPLYHTPQAYFRSMVQSVLDQSYQNWELILVNSTPEDAALSRAVTVWCRYDSRIQAVTLTDNLGIAGNTNAGIRKASGDFIAFMDHDDMLEPDALYCYAKELNKNPETDLFYSDEDKIGESDNVHFYPHFKSDFNPDLLCSNNYICHFLAVRTSLLKEVGGLDDRFDGAQDYDLIFRLTEKTDRIYHCPRILYHWRSHSESTSAAQGNKSYAITAGADAINAHYARIGRKAEAQIGPVDGWYTSRYELTGHPLVSILIPNKDHIEDLDTCVQSLLDRLTYDQFEIIVIENNSTEPETFAYYKKLESLDERIRVVFWDREFNYSAINNYGASFARGEYLLLLNNDVELITPDMLERMLGYCMREDVGMVGAKLLYNDHTVQHAGVVVGVGGLADHAFKGIHEEDPGYMGRASVTQDVSAVTAACLMIPKAVYEKVGGLDETFQVAFNDVDLCLKVRQAGYLIVYDAEVKLYHYESKSRGAEDTAERFSRFSREMQQLNNRWNILNSRSDPYYNPNLSYTKCYRLDTALAEERMKKIEEVQRIRYGRKEGNHRHTKLQRKEILKKVFGIH